REEGAGLFEDGREPGQFHRGPPACSTCGEPDAQFGVVAPPGSAQPFHAGPVAASRTPHRRPSRRCAPRTAPPVLPLCPSHRSACPAAVPLAPLRPSGPNELSALGVASTALRP